MCQLKHYEYDQRETRMGEFLVYDARVVSSNIARFQKEQQRLRAQGGPNFPSAVRVHSCTPLTQRRAFGRKPQWLGGVGVARTDFEASKSAHHKRHFTQLISLGRFAQLISLRVRFVVVAWPVYLAWKFSTLGNLPF